MFTTIQMPIFCETYANANIEIAPKLIKTHTPKVATTKTVQEKQTFEKVLSSPHQ